MRNIFLLITLTFSLACIAQNSMADMLFNLQKKQLESWRSPEKYTGEDQVLGKQASFVPPHGKFDGEGLVKKYIDSIKATATVNTGMAYRFNTDEGETDLNYVEVNLNWSFMPAWQQIAFRFVPITVKTTKGEEIKFDENKYNEYLEQGYIEPKGDFGVNAGETEQEVFISKDPETDEYPLTIKGTLEITYPSEFEAFTFTSAEIGKEQVLGKFKVTLLKIKENRAYFHVTGPRGFSDQYQYLCFNSNDQLFNGYGSSTNSWEFYELAKKNNYTINDEKLKEIVKKQQENMMTPEQDNIMIMEVQGALTKIVFFRTLHTGISEMHFEKSSQ